MPDAKDVFVFPGRKRGGQRRTPQELIEQPDRVDRRQGVIQAFRPEPLLLMRWFHLSTASHDTCLRLRSACDARRYSPRPHSPINSRAKYFDSLASSRTHFRPLARSARICAAESRTEKVPATYRVVKKQVMVEPPKARTVVVPAEYRTETVQELVENGKERRTRIPAEYAEIAKQTKVSGGRIEWRTILCQTNATADTVKRIQAALRRAGHDPGEIDGRIGRGTLAALRSYQDAKGLPAGQMTIETLATLGVKL